MEPKAKAKVKTASSSPKARMQAALQGVLKELKGEGRDSVRQPASLRGGSKRKVASNQRLSKRLCAEQAVVSGGLAARAAATTAAHGTAKAASSDSAPAAGSSASHGSGDGACSAGTDSSMQQLNQGQHGVTVKVEKDGGWPAEFQSLRGQPFDRGEYDRLRQQFYTERSVVAGARESTTRSGRRRVT